MALVTLSPASGIAHGRRAAAPHARSETVDPSYTLTDTPDNSSNPVQILGNQEDLQRRPASLTKLMTTFVTLKTVTDDAGKPAAARVFAKGLDTPIPISAAAAATTGSRLGLKPGSRERLGTLLLAMMDISANDAATAVGEALAGKDRKVSDLMNAEASRLGMMSTRFIDASGQDILPPNPPRQNISTARDMALLAECLYRGYGRQFPDILHPESMTFKGRRMGNIETDAPRVPGHSVR